MTLQAHLVKEHWVKPGAIVIDVGINAIPDSTKKSGRRLVGDVDFEKVVVLAPQSSMPPLLLEATFKPLFTAEGTGIGSFVGVGSAVHDPWEMPGLAELGVTVEGSRDKCMPCAIIAP